VLDLRTIYSLLKRVLVALTIAFSLMAVVGAAQYTLGDGLSDIVMKAAVFCLLSVLVSALHFWIHGLKLPNESFLFNVVVVVLIAEYVMSLSFVGLLVFDVGKMSGNLIFLGVFQLIHLAVYSLNWFLSEEGGPIHHPNLSADQIAAVNEQNRSPLAPRYQDGSNDG